MKGDDEITFEICSRKDEKANLLISFCESRHGAAIQRPHAALQKHYLRNNAWGSVLKTELKKSMARCCTIDATAMLILVGLGPRLCCNNGMAIWAGLLWHTFFEQQRRKYTKKPPYTIHEMKAKPTSTGGTYPKNPRPKNASQFPTEGPQFIVCGWPYCFTINW